MPLNFFFECGAASGEKGRNTTVKYTQLLKKRLEPWCANQDEPDPGADKRFDDMITVRAFYNSWLSEERSDNNLFVLEVNEQLEASTKRAMLERYRTFLGFCKENAWLQHNQAKKIKAVTPDVAPKYAWTLEEYQNINTTLETWEDEYGRTGEYEAERQLAYCLPCCATPASESRTFPCSALKIWLRNRQRKLVHIFEAGEDGFLLRFPFLPNLPRDFRRSRFVVNSKEPFMLKLARRTINYDTKFWFWTGESSTLTTTQRNGAKHVAAVLEQCQTEVREVQTKPSHRRTPSGHFFAITMLNAGVAN